MYSVTHFSKNSDYQYFSKTVKKGKKKHKSRQKKHKVSNFWRPKLPKVTKVTRQPTPKEQEKAFKRNLFLVLTLVMLCLKHKKACPKCLPAIKKA